MQSMASVLESLGSSLAAQAAAALIGMNWGGAALATAGSLAAYAAASWARSQKFASGGIVGGTSYLEIDFQTNAPCSSKCVEHVYVIRIDILLLGTYG